MIIYLTVHGTQKQVWINYLHLVSMRERDAGGTFIRTSDGAIHTVNETPGQILTQIPEMSRCV